MIPFDATRARLEQQLDAIYTCGVQMAVEVDGRRALDVAWGESGTGTAMTPGHLYRVYCTIKPITAVAIAQLVDDGTIDLDEPLAPRLPDLGPLAGGVTLRHILTHTAGLHRPTAVEMELLAPDKRRAAIAKASRPLGWRLGQAAAYSEYAAWHVLGWLLETVRGEPLRDLLRGMVLDPLELDSTWLGMTPDKYETLLPRLGLNVDMRGHTGIPMVFERTRRICLETNAAHGGYTTAGDLARFYSALLARLEGGGCEVLPSPDTLRLFCSPARPVLFDEVLDRECSHGLGFMTDLSYHAFGDRCGPSSFGHSGNVGTSFAFADPERGLAVGAIFNGLVDHETAFVRRRALVNALYSDLDVGLF